MDDKDNDDTVAHSYAIVTSELVVINNHMQRMGSCNQDSIVAVALTVICAPKSSRICVNSLGTKGTGNAGGNKKVMIKFVWPNSGFSKICLATCIE